MIDVRPLWDFDDPAGSEVRFRVAASQATDARTRAVHLTQVARACGLQEKYDEGHSLLDGISDTDAEVLIRIHLERGRLLRSAGRPAEAAPEFQAAEQAAQLAGEDFLRVDALHMAALVADAADQVPLTEQALEVAARSSDQAARDWDASLLNNLGMAHHQAGDLTAALAAFEAALAARLRIGRAGDIRVARWMIAWTLRLLGHTADALAMQRALRAELDAAGESDTHVDDEIALLTGGDTAGP